MLAPLPGLGVHPGGRVTRSVLSTLDFEEIQLV